jgi:serine/threonine-protein kinase
VKLTKEGYEAFRETVTLAEAEPSRAIAAEMKTGSVTVVLKVDPPPTVWVDGKPWAGERTRITGLSAGEEHRVVLSAAGYQAKTLTIVAQQGETKIVEERLIKADPSAAASSAPATPPKEDKPAEPAAAGGTGTIRVAAKGGFCNVTVNGAAYGPTPTQATVPAGTARVSCKPADGPAQSQAVVVAAGQIARVSFKLDP